MAKRRRKGAKVYVLPGVERRDMLSVIPSEQLLRRAIEAGVSDVVVIARDRAGKPYLASNITDVDKTVGRLMYAATFLAQCTLENDQVIDSDGVG